MYTYMYTKTVKENISVQKEYHTVESEMNFYYFTYAIKLFYPNVDQLSTMSNSENGTQ